MASSEHFLTCYNKGCRQKFTLEDNSERACVHHPGEAVFHDALKGWSCCKKRVSDFTEFLNIKGCTTSFHCAVKPPEPEKPAKAKEEETMVQLEKNPQHRQPNKKPAERPPDDEPLLPLKSVVGASLKTQLEKLSLKDDKTEAESDGTDGPVKIGTSCNNKGCKVSFEGDHINAENCIFHPGVPIFHEGMKYWTCCQRKTSRFEAFISQEGCETGHHNWYKPKVSQEKQVRVDWHQTPSIICLSIFTKVALPDKACIVANKVRCQVELVYDGGKSTFHKTFILREPVNPEKSEVKLLGTKVEVNLKKAEPFSWASLELPVSDNSSS